MRAQAETPKRVLKVIRLSDEKDTSTSTEGQDEQIEAWSARLGHIVVGKAEDTDVSARKVSPFKRPQLSKWLREPKLSEWDILVCSKQDRLFRSVADIGALTKWCMANGKSWASVAENTDLSNPAGRAAANMLAVFGEFEADRGGERRAESAERLARKGQWDGGRYPFGYIPKLNGVGWTLVQSEHAATVHEMAMRAIAGDSNGKIARWLNASGIKTSRGNEWMPEVIGKLLRNPALAGYSVSNGAIVRDDDGDNVMITDEPILTDDEWRKVIAALDSRKQNRAERVGGHTLLRVAYCRQCSTDVKPQPMYGHLKQGRSKTSIYRCQRCGFSLRMSELETKVEADVLAEIGHARLPRKVVTPAISHTAELETAERKIAEIDAAYDSGDLPIAAYSRQMTKWEAERDRLAALPQQPEHTDWVPTDVTVAEHWATLDKEGRGMFLRQWEVTIYADRNGATLRTGWQSVDGSGSELARAFGLTS